LRRIELAFPVESAGLHHRIVDEVLPRFLEDRVKARELQPEGNYRRLKPEGKENRSQAQWHFRERSRARAKRLTPAKEKSRDRLRPLSSHS